MTKTTELTRLVVTDYRVICFKILGAFDAQLVPEKDFEDYIKACWAIILNRGNDTVEWTPHTLLIVDDNNSEEHPYWRKELFPEYKANRSPKPDHWKSIAQIGLEYINKPKCSFYYLSKQGYEADDFAGALVGIKRMEQSLNGDPIIANRPIDLYTVDSDWLQLVGDGVLWHNTAHWLPRIRGIPEAIEWTKKRLRVDITHPSQIVDVKMLQGDKSDNLPPNSPAYLIDLINIHPDYNLLNHADIKKQLYNILSDLKPNVNLSHLEKAREWCLSKGYPLVC